MIPMGIEDIKEFKRNAIKVLCDNTQYATAKAVETVFEKQIPLKPITYNSFVKTKLGLELLDEKEKEYCPECLHLVLPPCEKYCSCCGQAIDWSESK